MKLTPAATNVWKHLFDFGAITRLEAQATYRIFDLPGRIMEVRNALDEQSEAAQPGEIVTHIDTTWKRDALGKRYASYSLVNRVKTGTSLVVAGPLLKLA